FFWFYSHPAVYVMILPAMGVVSEVIAVHSRKHIFGYRFIAYSSIAIAIFGFLVWGHHMFVSGQSKV
ncbi:MAG TPA: cytochrome c oxidase subunit I, partial [Planctomycetaceae bacterium]|nr:cytochrome c oxidase subunit I [Planctomycetaceae bacterium]